jgi:pimeloyl-ACP methyl ester carboxylesterase
VLKYRVLVLLSALALSGAQVVSQQRTDNYFEASDGIRIHYWEMGRGTPVVLIHGYRQSGQLWLDNGVADALGRNHRVMVVDARGHGLSDKPHDPLKYGPQMTEDVIELLDHLKIDKAHIHGFSMGGFMVTHLLTRHPARFLTASYGGSGIREVDPKWITKVPPDAEGTHPHEAAAWQALRDNPVLDREAVEAAAAYPLREGGERGQLDLTQVRIPVLAINGEYDGFHAKTHRMERELADFTNVMLAGHSHLSAIEPGYIPAQYIEALVQFIAEHDPGR